MKHKTWLFLMAGAILLIAGFIVLKNQTYDTGTVCHTNVVYKEVDSTLLPVDTEDKAHKVIENTFSSLNASNPDMQYFKEHYKIESYEKRSSNSPYTIIIVGSAGQRFTVLKDGTVEWYSCAY